MHKKLEKDLKDLAQEILQLNDFNEVDALRVKAHKLYEQLFALSFFNDHIKEIKNLSKNNSQSLDELKDSINQIQELKSKEQPILDNPSDSSDELEESDELGSFFEPKFESVKEDLSQKEEFKDTISLDETEKLFETKKTEEKQLSLHDKFITNRIQIGLNDRIAFVNNLFNFSQSDFNTVLGELNSYKSKKEALNYINYSVKPKYNWKGKEELEERFLVIIERKFI
ncbi:MAG: hypothetical protein ABFR32_08735 [Bacteroidota bacterium]